MRALVQRVTEAAVSCDGVEVGRIAEGLCVFVGITHTDDNSLVPRMAEKLWNLRIIDDDDGVMNRSLAETTRQILIVSQFTLYGDARKGRRPSWIDAARPEDAEPLIDSLVAELEGLGATVATGRFRAEMQVSLVNDGPATLMLEM